MTHQVLVYKLQYLIIQKLKEDGNTNGFIFKNFNGNEAQLVNADAGPMVFKTNDTERMRIDSSGNVGIGTSSPDVNLEIATSTSDTGVDLKLNGNKSSNGAVGSIIFENASDSVAMIRASRVGGNNDAADMQFFTQATGGSNTERMRIDSSGNLVVGHTSAILSASNRGNVTINGASESILSLGINGSQGGYLYHDGTTQYLVNTKNGGQRFFTNNTERMRIDSSGNVGIGETSPESIMHIKKAASGSSYSADGSDLVIIENNSSAAIDVRTPTGDSGAIQFSDTTRARVQSFNYHSLDDMYFNVAGTSGSMVLNSSGNLAITGALSKGSGSFRIDHPLESKTDTHDLVHSFVEAPQADNIYRGKVDLVDGSATVNIDTVSGMTEGTFIALNTDVQCFTTNESDWDAVKGSVTGNILTINCQNTSSTASISWLVIGERHDQHMKDTDWTDSDGKVIVEPLKG